ncbi:MAG: M20 family metallopeptidase [Anaerolineales bacterium]
MQDLLTYFRARQDDLIAATERLVTYESFTADKPRVDALIAVLEADLQALGAHLTHHPREEVGDILLAEWQREAPGAPILMLAHVDTVWPPGTLADAVPLQRDDHKLHGPGTVDMKAGIVIAIEAVHALQVRDEMPARPIRLLLTTDEETGSLHSRDLIVQTAQDCCLSLVLEGSAEGESLKTSRKGNAKYWVTAQGKAAHAGLEPEAGVNAIIELAHQAIAVNALNDLRAGTSVTVSIFEGGGVANVVPARAELFADVRYFSQDEAERIDAAVRALEPATFGATLAVRGGIERPPMERTAQTVRAMAQAQRLAEGLGLPLGEAAVGGVSDGNYTAQAGIPTLDGLGASGAGAHALHEHILTRSLPRRAALVASILRDWDESA